MEAKMINDFIINIEHIGLIVILSVPFVLGIYFIYKTAQKKTTNLKERLVVSIQIGIASIHIYLTNISSFTPGL